MTHHLEGTTTLRGLRIRMLVVYQEAGASREVKYYYQLRNIIKVIMFE
jgi:hypothetical protein